MVCEEGWKGRSRRRLGQGCGDGDGGERSQFGRWRGRVGFWGRYGQRVVELWVLFRRVVGVLQCLLFSVFICTDIRYQDVLVGFRCGECGYQDMGFCFYSGSISFGGTILVVVFVQEVKGFLVIGFEGRECEKYFFY